MYVTSHKSIGIPVTMICSLALFLHDVKFPALQARAATTTEEVPAP
jgi:hypothetical protein